MTDTRIPDAFDRILGAVTGLPDHVTSRPATVTTILPMLGNAQTYIVRTCRTDRGEYIGFIEMVEATGHVRLVIPAKAMAAIYRQRDTTTTAKRRADGRARWAAEHPDWQPKPRRPRRRRSATA